MVNTKQHPEAGLLTGRKWNLQKNVFNEIIWFMKLIIVQLFIDLAYLEFNETVISPANTLRKSNVILRFYFGNLRKLFSANVDVT